MPIFDNFATFFYTQFVKMFSAAVTLFDIVTTPLVDVLNASSIEFIIGILDSFEILPDFFVNLVLEFLSLSLFELAFMGAAFGYVVYCIVCWIINIVS